MKRFLLFSGDGYYPNGGVEDFIRGFSSPESIEQHLRALADKGEKPDWSNVLDIQTGTKYYIDRYTYQLVKLQNNKDMR